MRVALNPAAHGIFHAAERAFESKATAPTAADMARICSEAAGAGGEVVHIDARPDNPPDSVDQLISCANSHSVGWEPRHQRCCLGANEPPALSHRRLHGGHGGTTLLSRRS